MRRFRSRFRFTIPALVVALAVTTFVMWWTQADLARASFWRNVGNIRRSYACALNAPVSAAREDFLEMLGRVSVQRSGVIEPFGVRWVREAPPRKEKESHRTRLPSWTRMGPHGRDVERFLEDARTWPWLACLAKATPDEIAAHLRELQVLNAFELQLREREPERIESAPLWWNLALFEAEREAEGAAMAIGGLVTERMKPIPGLLPFHGIAPPGAVAYHGKLPVILPLWTIPAAAREIVVGRDDLASAREHVRWMRLGHLARYGDDGELHCLSCGEMAGPPLGVEERPDGSLVWYEPSGRRCETPPLEWLPTAR